MPSGATAGVLRRIKGSAHRIDVVYPRVRVTVGTAAPEALPLSPLTGSPFAPTLVPQATTPVKPPVTGVHCLWYDMTGKSEGVIAGFRRTMSTVGWRDGAVAVACVAATDVAVDPLNPYGATIFDDCDALVHMTLRYHLLGAAPGGNGMDIPGVYMVWLASADGQ